jgi:hypothetical protein
MRRKLRSDKGFRQETSISVSDDEISFVGMEMITTMMRELRRRKRLEYKIR